MSTCSTKYKLGLLCLFAAAYGFFYIVPNFRPFWPPQQLALTALDKAVPMVPWTFIIYLSDYLMVVSIIFLIKDPEKFNDFSRIAFGVLFFCGLFFIFFPTTYPRPEYPTSDSIVVRFFMNLVGTADTPNNCFPSMHVAITSASTWCVRYMRRNLYVFFWFWSIAIFISTLTTKQHYVYDIVGGLAATAIVAFTHWALMEKKGLRGILSKNL